MLVQGFSGGSTQLGSIQLGYSVRRGHIGELDPDIWGHRGISAGPTQFGGMGVVVLDPRSLGTRGVSVLDPRSWGHGGYQCWTHAVGGTGGISAGPTQLGARGY